MNKRFLSGLIFGGGLAIVLAPASASAVGTNGHSPLGPIDHSPPLSWGAQVDSNIDTTGVLRVGIRQDILPLGQRGEDGWTGYCADVAEALARHLSRSRLNPIQVVFITSTTQSRYLLVASGTVDMECGPNSINPDAETTFEIKFSTPFFVTATQVFTRPGAQISDVARSGVIKGTTNEADLNQIYPSSLVDNSFVDYEQGINAVLRGEISGFASDGVLLVGSARRLNLVPYQDYVLTTPKRGDGTPFCASYGMILPGGVENSRWRNMVNHFLANHRDAKVVWRRWFSRLDSSIQAVSTACFGS
ncbi:transporter substrate-binding domain-containing protein [[Phormidium] sp. ETS-05]|uniref:transporter substrate-binding domain-containing protein n=1 Tax=[Phormidium] sp. ETS-05 TaxID=222819 RepID=UPI0018EED3FE|nr:transporter substrate-binding domain-containing protein [[Phormidium] sp. ETS-05]